MAEAQMVLGLVGRVLGAPQLPGQALTVLGHPNVVANEGLEWFDASLKPRSLTHHRI
jgi:hypothetical protein